jgi:uncharacterized membrane protein required for colicin V production
MVVIDYIFLLVTILYSVLGYIKGFSKQLISFSIWILFLYIIFNYLPNLKYIVSSYVRLDDIYIKVLSIILLVAASITLIFILNLTLAKVIASTLFENSNQIIGCIMSFVKSQIFILIFILLIYDTSITNLIFDNSILMPYYLQFFEYISNFDDSLFNTFEI